MEFVRRRSLEQEHTTLPGFHPENKQKMADTPTAERLLKAFADVSLTIIKHATGEEILRVGSPPCQGCRKLSQGHLVFT